MELNLEMTNSEGKIVILVPNKTARGGITNYYYSIKKDLPDNVIYVTRGAKNWPTKTSKIDQLKRLVIDYYNFTKILIKEDVSVVQIPTPFASGSIYRDILYILISKIFFKKVIVFFRGWVDDFVYNLSGIKLFLIKKMLFAADSIIELSESNIAHLKKLGYKKEIYLETTLVDRSLIENFNFDEILQKRIDSPVKTILFLSRIEKEKGVYDLLDVFKKVKESHAEFNLIFAGDGDDELNLLKKVREQNIENVCFAGFVSGEEKVRLFENSTIFVFLSEREGMPNAVLEAMAFGLPVITTNVGGVASVFKEGINGSLLESSNIEFIAEQIINTVNDRIKYKQISTNNYSEAKNKFVSNVVAKRMMKIFMKTVGKEENPIMQSNDKALENVKDFWSKHPCGSQYSSNTDRKKYFEEIEAHRYKKIRSIKGIADFNQFKGKRVLEVGCGLGTDGRQFGRNEAIYTGINLDEGSTSYAKDGFDLLKVPGEVIQMNAEKMEFADNTFDHIYSHGVIHHSPSTEKIVQEMFRVLKPGGTINIMIYNRSSINYYFEIMFLRKIFRLVLFPKWAPGLFSKLTGFEKAMLERHREIMMREKMSKERWIAINTDGPDCPIAKVYNRAEAIKLVSQGGFVNSKNFVRYLNKEHYSFLGKLIPNFLADFLGNTAGWHRWIKAEKPIK